MELPVAIALSTGMRRGEILGLRWSDLDTAFTVAHVRRTLQPAGGLSFHEPKTTRSRRTVQLPEFLRPFLDRQRADQTTRKKEDPGRWHETGLVVDSGHGSAGASVTPPSGSRSISIPMCCRACSQRP